MTQISWGWRYKDHLYFFKINISWIRFKVTLVEFVGYPIGDPTTLDLSELKQNKANF